MKKAILAASIAAYLGMLGEPPFVIPMASRRSRQRRDKRQPWDEPERGNE